MLVEELAERCHVRFEKRLGYETEGRRPVYVDTASVLLKSQPGDVSEEAFVQAFRESEAHIEDPMGLYAHAVLGVQALLGGRQILDEEEVRAVAADSSCHDIYGIKFLRGNPSLTFSNDGSEGHVYLPNSWYLRSKPHRRPVITWRRGEESYVGPMEESIVEHVRGLTWKQEIVEVLDAGTGSGFFPKRLKEIFGERLQTTGLGLRNQMNAVDENVVGPMEVLPEGWTDRFDVVFSNYALCYTTFPEKCLSELLRVLRPGRAAFLDVGPHRKSDWAVEVERVKGELLGRRGRFEREETQLPYLRLKSFEGVKGVIESLGGGGYVVSPARPGDSFGICVQVRKNG